MRPDPDCRLCDLCEGRTNIVLPDGDPDSKIIFVGEAPGETEDLQGKPFVGKSGKILTAMMEEAGFSRKDVLITNTVKCRPPGNRDPTDEEMDSCRRFLCSELENASLVVGLGKSACRSLTGYQGSMGRIVNKRTLIFINGKKIPFLPAYHPASTIYNRKYREDLAETMRIVAEELK